MNPFLENNPYALGGGRQPQDPNMLLTPEEEQSLTANLLQRTMGGLETAGWLLDTPGAIARGFLAGRPFERVSGRELLTSYGLTKENDPNAWEWADVAGLGADILVDPLTFVGGQALSQAGKLAKSAGVLDDAVKVATKNAGKKVGKRQAKLTTTLDDMMAGLEPTQLAKLQQTAAAQGVDLGAIGQQRLGSLVGYDIPFTNISGAIGGQGGASQAAAAGLDAAGKAIAESLPGRTIRNLFDASVAGTKSAPAQEVMSQISRLHDVSRQDAQVWKNDFFRGLGDEAANDAAITLVLEHPEEAASAPAELFKRFGVAPLSDESTAKVIASRQVIDDGQSAIQGVGLDPAEWISEVGTKYAPRYANMPRFAEGGGTRASGNRQFNLKRDSDIARETALDIEGGTTSVNQFTSDLNVSGPKSAITKGEDRTWYVLQNNPATRQIFDGPQAKSADGLTFKAHNASKAADETETLMLVDPAALDKGWQAGLPNLYIGQGTEGIPGRRAQFRDFMSEQKPIEASRIDINPTNGAVQFGDGRHRFAEMRDLGVKQVGIMVPNSQVEAAQKLFGATPVGEAVDPKDIMERIARKTEDGVDLTPEELALQAQYNRADAFQKKLSTLDPAYRQYNEKLFGNHPIENIARYADDSRFVAANADGIHQIFAETAINEPKFGYKPLADALKEVGFGQKKLDADGKEFLDLSVAEGRVAEHLKQRGKTADNVYVPDESIGDAIRVMQPMKDPEWMRMFDVVNRATKTFLTMSPSFHTRNVGGGQYQNAAVGSYNVPLRKLPGMLADAGRLAIGKPTKNLHKNAAVVQALGKDVPEEDALKYVMELAQTNRAVDSSISDVVGKELAPRNKPDQRVPATQVGDVVERIATGEELRITGNGTGQNAGKVYTQRGGQRRLEDPNVLALTQARPSRSEMFGGNTPLERAMGSSPFEGAQSVAQSVGDFGRDLRKGVVDTVSPLLGPGTVGQRLRQSGQNLKNSSLNPANIGGVRGEVSRFAPAKLHEKISQSSEILNRMSAFLGWLEQGVHPAEAAARVRASHVDYGDLTQFEKSFMKRLVPFYSFTRKQGEFVAQNLLERPGGGISQTIQATNSGRTDDTWLPDYVGEGAALKIPGSQDSYITGLGLMHEGPLNSFAVGSNLASSLGRTAQKTLAQTNPLVKGPIELATGKSLFTGRDLKDLYQFPFSNKNNENAQLANMLLMNSPASRWLTLSRKLMDDRKGVGERAVNLLTGINTTTLSGGIERAKEMEARKALEDMLRESPKVRSYQSLYVPEKEKANLTPDELKALGLYKLMNKRAKEAAKKRAEEKKG